MLKGTPAKDNLRSLAWGLDLANPEVTTQEEIDEFRRTSDAQWGVQQDGLGFWLDTNPEVLKRYRLWSDTLNVRGAEAPVGWSPNAASIRIIYACTDFQAGLRYMLRGMSKALTKEQILEEFALNFRYTGPRGMAAIANALKGYDWPAPTQPVKWPSGWGPDPGAFRSGADFKSAGASAADTAKILEWYERLLGEIPPHVAFFAKHRPELLKAYRQRYENTLRLLPKQTEPWVLLQSSIRAGFRHGIREGMLLGRAFGISKKQILEAISWGTFYGGNEAVGVIEEVAGDVLDAWPE